MPDPSKFDWVRARAQCSLRPVFENLAGTIQKDVESAIKLSEEERNSKTMLHYARDRNTITVTSEPASTKDAAQPQGVVRFALSATEITVERQNAKQFSILASLNSNGDCKIVANGQEVELWQVSRMALEGLFFGA